VKHGDIGHSVYIFAITNSAWITSWVVFSLSVFVVQISTKTQLYL